MAFITSIDSITTGSDLSEAQIKGIVNRIDLIIYNLNDPSKPFDAAEYAEFGSSGHKMNPTALLETLMKLRDKYEGMLADVPQEIHSQWDDPAF